MVRELTFLKQLVINQWRTMVFSKKSSSSLLWYLLILLPFILYKYFQFLNLSGHLLIQPGGDNNPLTILFYINTGAWAISAWGSQQISDQLKRNRFFPFNIKSLFGIKLLSLFLSPTSIIAFIFSLLSFYPVFYATDFITAALYATGLISFAVFANFTASNLLNIRGGRFVVFSFAALIIIGATFFQSFTGIAPDQFNTALGGILRAALFDNSLVLNLAGALSVTVVTVTAGFLSFRAFLEQETGAGSSSGRVRYSVFDNFKLSTKYGLLVKKDLGYVFRLSPAPYISLLIAIYYAYFLTFSNEGGRQSLSVFLSYVFIPHTLMFFNFFGFDTLPGIERSAAFPLSASETVKIKNLSAVIVSGLSFVIILPVVLFKFGPVIAVSSLLKWSLLAAGYLICGNFLSVFSPFSRRKPGGLPAKSLFGYAGAVMIISLMLVVMDSLGQESVVRSMWISCFVLLVYMMIYFISLLWIKKNLHRFWESIRRSVV